MASEPTLDLCAEFILPQAQVRAWLAGAEIGSSLVYCRARKPIYGETWTLVGELARGGIVHPTHPWSVQCDGFRDYSIRVLKQPEAPRARKAAAETDEATDKIFSILKRAANFGRRCPVNIELARAAGLSTVEQAKWRIQKLVQAKLITTWVVPVGPEAGFRVVTIVATGRRTELPQCWNAYFGDEA